MINRTDIVEAQVTKATMTDEDSELNVIANFSQNASVTSMSSQAWGSITRSGKSYALTAEMMDSLMAFGAISFKADAEGLLSDSPETNGQRVEIDCIIPTSIQNSPSSVTQFDNVDNDLSDEEYLVKV
jgi:hypothetical protein